MPKYHIQLNKTDLRSPAAAAFEVGGGVGRCAKTNSATLAKARKTTNVTTRRILVPDLGDHVGVVHIAAWIAFANVGLGIRIESQCSRSHDPRLEQHTGIVYRDLIP